MGFFSNLFGKSGTGKNNKKNIWGKYTDDLDDIYDISSGKIDESEWDDVAIRRSDVDIKNPVQREGYVNRCLEQMAEASAEIDKLAGEYALITEYLTDMEELEAMPKRTFKEIKTCASKLMDLEDDKQAFLSRKNRMSDASFEQVRRMEPDVEEGIRKIRETEDYHKLIRRDLARLEGEKHAYRYRRQELAEFQANSRGMTVICITAFVVCMIMLFALSALFFLEVKLAAIITTALAALAITLLYFRYTDSVREQKRVENTINKIILLQNRVKIKYVNNRNLLDYYYLKYGVDNGAELEGLWKLYTDEKAEREKFSQVKEDFVFYDSELQRLLGKYHIRHPQIWGRQAAALIDHGEMVEVRHALITQRQSLRKQMDYNKGLAEGASREIKSLVADYPEYAQEIKDRIAHQKEGA